MSTPPFDPHEFYLLARQLAQQTDECRLRTAVARAYYAVFLTARDNLSVPRKTRDVHAVVIATLKRRKFTILASQLDQLRKLRTEADYDMVPQDPARANWPKNWTEADRLATRLLPAVKRLR